MKRWFLLLLLFLSALCYGQSFEDSVDFDVELSSLNNAETVSRVLSSGKVVLLEGFFDSAIIKQNGQSTEVWVTLVGGAWIGTEEVISYSCDILFQEEQWEDVFINAQENSPDYIPQGSHLLIAARLTGYDKNSKRARAKMVNFRVLE